jgi:predicted enzyme related to lactoylglutathione lyase
MGARGRFKRVTVLGLDHVQLAAPPGCEAQARRFIEPDDLDALAARLAQAGAKVGWDDALPGVRRFYTEDPWGNRVEVLANPRLEG